MPFVLSLNSQLQCTMGLTPAPFIVLPDKKVVGKFLPLATMDANKPMVNIMPFGMCKSPANPVVASIIASSLGSVTQAPCIPNTVAPWIPSCMKVMVGNMPVVTQPDKLMCIWGGSISAISSGQMCVDAK